MGALNRESWIEDRLGHWLTLEWARGLTEVLSALDLTGSADEVTFEPNHPKPESWPGWSDPLWLTLPIDVAAAAAINIGCPLATAHRLAAVIMGDDDIEADAIRETYVELVNQVASSISPTASEKFGSTVKIGLVSVQDEGAGAEDAELAVEYAFSADETAHPLVLAPNPAALEAIQAADQHQVAEAASAGAEGAAGGVPEAPHSAGSVEPPSRGLTLDPAAQQNLAMLFEVDLDLSVSFGTTELPLQEVLKLASGSIVELNRSVNEPVDVLVNNCVVARGDVVVVDGNYGIRVTEIVSRKERIQSIF